MSKDIQSAIAESSPGSRFKKLEICINGVKQTILVPIGGKAKRKLVKNSVQAEPICVEENDDECNVSLHSSKIRRKEKKSSVKSAVSSAKSCDAIKLTNVPAILSKARVNRASDVNRSLTTSVSSNVVSNIIENSASADKPDFNIISVYSECNRSSVEPETIDLRDDSDDCSSAVNGTEEMNSIQLQCNEILPNSPSSLRVISITPNSSTVNLEGYGNGTDSNLVSTKVITGITGNISSSNNFVISLTNSPTFAFSNPSLKLSSSVALSILTSSLPNTALSNTNFPVSLRWPLLSPCFQNSASTVNSLPQILPTYNIPTSTNFQFPGSAENSANLQGNVQFLGSINLPQSNSSQDSTDLSDTGMNLRQAVQECLSKVDNDSRFDEQRVKLLDKLREIMMRSQISVDSPGLAQQSLAGTSNVLTYSGPAGTCLNVLSEISVPSDGLNVNSITSCSVPTIAQPVALSSNVLVIQPDLSLIYSNPKSYSGGLVNICNDPILSLGTTLPIINNPVNVSSNGSCLSNGLNNDDLETRFNILKEKFLARNENKSCSENTNGNNNNGNGINGLTSLTKEALISKLLGSESSSLNEKNSDQSKLKAGDESKTKLSRPEKRQSAAVINALAKLRPLRIKDPSLRSTVSTIEFTVLPNMQQLQSAATQLQCLKQSVLNGPSSPLYPLSVVRASEEFAGNTSSNLSEQLLFQDICGKLTENEINRPDLKFPDNVESSCIDGNVRAAKCSVDVKPESVSFDISHLDSTMIGDKNSCVGSTSIPSNSDSSIDSLMDAFKDLTEPYSSAQNEFLISVKENNLQRRNSDTASNKTKISDNINSLGGYKSSNFEKRFVSIGKSPKNWTTYYSKIRDGKIQKKRRKCSRIKLRDDWSKAEFSELLRSDKDFESDDESNLSCSSSYESQSESSDSNWSSDDSVAAWQAQKRRKKSRRASHKSARRYKKKHLKCQPLQRLQHCLRYRSNSSYVKLMNLSTSALHCYVSLEVLDLHGRNCISISELEGSACCKLINGISEAKNKNNWIHKRSKMRAVSKYVDLKNQRDDHGKHGRDSGLHDKVVNLPANFNSSGSETEEYSGDEVHNISKSCELSNRKNSEILSRNNEPETKTLSTSELKEMDLISSDTCKGIEVLLKTTCDKDADALLSLDKEEKFDAFSKEKESENDALSLKEGVLSDKEEVVQPAKEDEKNDASCRDSKENIDSLPLNSETVVI